ncbi:MAG TPA: site-specific integrase, partial [Patescibacteria group bacterium]
MNYIQKFKDYLLALRPAPSKITVKNYSIDVKHFISWVEAQTQRTFNPQEVTFSDIEKFRLDKKLQLSVRSLDRHVSSLRKFFQALKLQGVIAESPFELMKQQIQPAADPFHLKQFKDFLYVYNASNLTIKNYIIDVKQFLNWAQEVTKNEGIAVENILSRIDGAFVKSYRDRLMEEKVFSPASINRKLSSLRKYLSWAGSQNLLEMKEAFQNNLNNIENVASAYSVLPPKTMLSEAKSAIEEPGDTHKQSYSPFPPFRVAQKLGRAGLLVFDAVVTAPLTHVLAAGHKTVWSLRGKPLFKKDNAISRLRTNIRVENISKSLFAPLTVSLKDLPWHKKVIFHAKFTRPEWYKRYHSYAISHYFHWAILIIFTTAIGFGFYNNFVEKPKNSQPTLAATAPPRILSFQGRLTDANNNPIVSATNLRFAIYNSISSTGSALLWEEVDRVQPDANGVFSVLLGNSTTIPQSLFANNSSLFLGIAVGQTPELTPRQQLATVAYATNAETLQGLPPITNTGNTTNVVLALDGSGNLTIGGTA